MIIYPSQQGYDVPCMEGYEVMNNRISSRVNLVPLFKVNALLNSHTSIGRKRRPDYYLLQEEEKWETSPTQTGPADGTGQKSQN